MPRELLDDYQSCYKLHRPTSSLLSVQWQLLTASSAAHCAAQLAAAAAWHVYGMGQQPCIW
jgi:hypothetical protein